MFYTLAIVSMLGYAAQTALLVPEARRMDGLSLAVYRNLSFAVTLLPLLIGSTGGDGAQGAFFDRAVDAFQYDAREADD